MTDPVAGSSSAFSRNIEAAEAAPEPGPVSLARAAPGPTPATAQLVSAHSLLPQVSPECVERAVDVAKGAGGLAAAAGALLASGTAGPVGAFIGAAMIFGAVLANYRNCELDAALHRGTGK